MPLTYALPKNMRKQEGRFSHPRGIPEYEITDDFDSILTLIDAYKPTGEQRVKISQMDRTILN